MPYFKYHSKQIYYREFGNGKPIMLLHGDAVSSKLFEPLLPLYQREFRVIAIDFLGCGESDRIDQVPENLWVSQAWQVIGLMEHLDCGKVSLVGTSGGAWVAVNAALERPDLVDKVVADSFDGRELAEDFSENLLEERAFAKGDNFSRQFYEWCQGEDWETVVDFNTRALVRCAERRLPLFCKPLEGLQAPILFLGSRKDTMCRKDMAEEYSQMEEIVPDGRVFLFPDGDHPSIATNAELAARVITEFING